MIKLLHLLAISNLIATASLAQCQQLTRMASKFSDKTIVMTMSPGRGSTEPVQYKRVSEKGQIRYFVQLYTEGGSFLPQKGATVVFKDGAQIQWTDATVKPFFQKDHYVSRCVINLPEDLLDQFQEKEISLIKLSTTERLLTLPQSQRAKNILNCVIFSDVIETPSDKLVSQ